VGRQFLSLRKECSSLSSPLVRTMAVHTLKGKDKVENLAKGGVRVRSITAVRLLWYFFPPSLYLSPKGREELEEIGIKTF
jgi:hypothetical protein